MEEKVQCVLKLIEEDGDSFAKRAEMYYKKRPEIISFVEEAYRGYRALAERYDHISTELQNANHTLATVFPEQIQLSMDEEDEDAAPRLPKKSSAPSDIRKNIPKAPKDPLKELKVIFSSASASKKLQPRKGKKSSSSSTVAKSGLSKPQAREEIDKLQKDILALQTETEFVKSSYESGLAKYWEIEDEIKVKHERIIKLQDEFGTNVVIEDDEARTLMAAAALKSCHETLAQLQEKQEIAAKETKMERKRIKDFGKKLSSMKNEIIPDQMTKGNPGAVDNEFEDALMNSKKEESNSAQATQDVELLREKIKKHFEAGSSSNLTVTEMAEKIDELVNKVISLESAVSSQTALVKTLREENDDLQTQIRVLEEDKESLANDTSIASKRLIETEEKFQGIQELHKSVEDQNNNLQTHFTEAQCNFDHLSEKLNILTPDEELGITGPSQREEEPLVEVSTKEEKPQVDALSRNAGSDNPQRLNPKADLGVTGPLTIADISSKEELNGQRDAMNIISKEEINGQQDATIPESSGQNLQGVKRDEMRKLEDSPVGGVSSMDEIKSHEGTEEHKPLVLGKSSEENTDPSATSAKDQEEKGVQSPEKDGPQSHFEEQIESEGPNKMDSRAPSKILDNLPQTEPEKRPTAEDDEPDWRQLYMNGMDNREENLLHEYTTVLRNYKDVKKKLTSVEKKIEGSLSDSLIRDLKIANASKEEEIRSLRQKLSLMQRLLDQNKDDKEFNTPTHRRKSALLDDLDFTALTGEEEESDDIKIIPIDQSHSVSPVEERFRTSIDELLELNLDFWLRFSTSFSEIQKFETEVQDLQTELSRIEEKGKKHEGSSSAKYNVKSEVRPIYKHLREIHAELGVWLEKSVLLKDELKSRFSSLCDIQEEIKAALRESAEEDDFTFTTYQAAKFQGEVLNMKQENNKVADELQAGMDHVTTLQLEVERTLAKLNEDFKLSGSKKEVNPEFIHSDSHSRVPLRSFIFGVKPKRQRPSIFACVSPVLYRRHNNRSGTQLQ